MAANIETKRPFITAWISRETEIDSIKYRLLDEPASGLAAWARTTSGIVALLVFLQFATGILLAFHYVPAAASAYTTVAYIELAVANGTWIRSVHYHSSVLLPIALSVHLLQMLVRSSYRSNPTAWVFGLLVLGLSLAAGATGYALPWDARAINGVNIAASLAGNTPLIGDAARLWLINGTSISTQTLSRFYGLHVFVLPLVLLITITARLFVFGKRRTIDSDRRLSDWASKQFARNSISVGLVFLAVSVFSAYYPAPFGPQAADVAATYLPRPGPQFLWLFEMQKYTDGVVAATLAMGFPSAVIGGLIILPLLLKRMPKFLPYAVAATFTVGSVAVGLLTAAAIYQDLSDSRISEQLARQEKDEAAFRRSTFEPQTQQIRHASLKSEEKPASDDPSSELTSVSSPSAKPSVYEVNCAKCHGDNGEGTKKFPELVGITTREEDQLSPEMVLAIINDPKAVGRSSKMPAYKSKLSEPEKQELVAWIRSLSTKSDEGEVVQTARVDTSK